MLDLSSFPVVLLLNCLAGAVGYLAARVAIWGLHRRAYSLECAVADLEDKLLIEVKRRAGSESAKSKKRDQELIDFAQSAAQTPPAPPQPWWLPYASKQRDT